MVVRYPRPLRPGDTIGVTAPSAPVPAALDARLDHAIERLRARGFDVRVGDCLRGDGVTSAPAADRAAELASMLTDPEVRAVVPPWGGSLAIDLLGLLDWDELAHDPTWLVGFSDLSTLLMPLTLRTGVASLHGQNLMDTPYRVPEPLHHWLDVLAEPAGAVVVQGAAAAYRAGGWDDYEGDPTVHEFTLDTPAGWTRLDADDPVEVTGRLIGGCIETVGNLAGTPYGDIGAFASEHAPEGLIVHLEASSADSDEIGRRLWGMRHAGWFERANAVLVGRTRAPGVDGFSQHDAVLDALGGLGLPVIADVECGHVAPYLALVEGALATVTHGPGESRIEQRLA
ncbi:LD-carboxypeptidase [Paraoerskovia sediminicola]|uniref:LD-carboxypeptidase n=1 Tax=Paraoerskovia sediminicola TaxID=1138587 RepID=A0ABM8G2E4_9CELL|nr:S66 peptidase family protein [Paraoerskovia sediminicola]BDZ42156.1 LD-carboxypeptidase [Paraoerskovia sediminicola]